jgi:hypothetical protein
VTFALSAASVWNTSLTLVFDDRAADHVAGSEKIEILVDLVETNGLHRVPDPALLNERDDFA